MHADVTTVDQIEDVVGDLVEADLVSPPGAVSTVDGNHPDPVTLGQPDYDEQGLLRWGSVPTPR